MREIEALGRLALAVQLDVAQPAGFGSRVRDALPHFGRDTFDFLVNNGGFSRGGMIGEITAEDIDALVGSTSRA